MYNVFLKLFLIKNTFKSFFLYFIFYILYQYTKTPENN